MDWHSAVARFDFFGGSSVEDLQASCDAIPEAAGVYILRRLQPKPVAFLPTNPGGRFRGRDPTVSISRLEERWIPSAEVFYIRKAGGNDQRATLRSRSAPSCSLVSARPALIGAAAASGSWRMRRRSVCIRQ